jgi:hypothetical protein
MHFLSKEPKNSTSLGGFKSAFLPRQWKKIRGLFLWRGFMRGLLSKNHTEP